MQVSAFCDFPILCYLTVQEATAITPVKETQSLLPASWGTKMIAEVYQYKINHSNVITVPVFNEENVCFNGAKFPEKLEDGISYNVGGGTILMKKVKLSAESIVQ